MFSCWLIELYESLEQVVIDYSSLKSPPQAVNLPATKADVSQITCPNRILPLELLLV